MSWEWVVAGVALLAWPVVAVVGVVFDLLRDRRDRGVVEREQRRRNLPGSIARLERETGVSDGT